MDNQHLSVSVADDDNTILLPASLYHLPPPWHTGLINQLDNDVNIVHEEPHDDVPDDLPNPHLNGEVSSFVLEDHGPADDITEVIVIIKRSWLPERWLSLSTRARSS